MIFFFFFNICVGLGKSQKNKDKNIVSRNGMASKVKNAIHSKYLLFQIMIHSGATMRMKISMSPYIYIYCLPIFDQAAIDEANGISLSCEATDNS